MIPNPIVIPVTLSNTQTTVGMNMQNILAPVQIDFTASVETLEPGDDATVDYSNKHFSFGIPRGEQGIQGETGPQGEKGDKGDTGATGATGPAYTLTSEDKTAIANEVLAALPNGDEVSY